MGDPEVFEPGCFSWETELSSHWRAIRAEAEAVLALREEVPSFHEVSPDQYRISQGDFWKTFWLRGFGQRSEICSAFCPVTDRVLERIPGLENALFSMLSPGSHIVAHKGVSKGIINCHLGLLVPEKKERCRMRVGSSYFHWEEGEVRIFDDTYSHEVWNDTDQERVVLMLQFRRPLRAPGAQIRDFFFEVLKRTPYVTVALENQRRFEEHFKTLVPPDGLPQAPPPAAG